MKLAGETQAMLVKYALIGGAVIVAAWWLKGRAAELGAAAANAVTEPLRAAWAGITDTAAAVARPVTRTIEEVRQASPGRDLPPGWYRVQTPYGELVTQFPDRYKTLRRADLVEVDP